MQSEKIEINLNKNKVIVKMKTIIIDRFDEKKKEKRFLKYFSRLFKLLETLLEDDDEKEEEYIRRGDCHIEEVFARANVRNSHEGKRSPREDVPNNERERGTNPRTCS